MNTIQLNARGHEMVFTKRSLTIDGREYLYKDMSSIKHSAENRIYIFRYDNEWQKLYYEEHDAHIVNTLFQRIAGMNRAKRANRARAAAESEQTQQPHTAETSAEETPAEASPGEAPAEEVQTDEPSGEEEPETPEAETTDTPVTEADLFYTIHPGSENKPVITDTILREDALRKSEIEARLAEAEARETEDAEAKTADTDAVSDKSDLPEVEFSDTQEDENSRETTSKFKLKKALIILAIVLAFFVLLGVVRYALFGLSWSPNYETEKNQTNQYNDIDELINDLQ